MNHLLKKLFLELSDDSENDYGKPVYRQEKDKDYKKLVAERD